MRTSEIKLDKLYYVKEKNRKAFIARNVTLNSIPEHYLEAWFKPGPVSIINRGTRDRVKLRCFNEEIGWWYGNDDLSLVEEYNPYVQEEMEI